MNAEELLRRAARLVDTTRRERPLVHHITNDVTLLLSANAVLALGGSPVMSSSPQESADITAQAHSLVVNTGTPHEHSVKAMFRSARRARTEGVPAVLDPVGAGFTPYRNKAIRSLASTGAFSVIKGNSSEMAWLTGLGRGARGVDARSERYTARKIASLCTARFKTVCVVTGPADVISSGESLFFVKGGSPMAGSMPGAGCLAASLCGLYLACASSPLEAAAAALLVLRAASAISGSSAQGIASFQTGLIDAFMRINGEDIFRGGILHDA